MSMGLFSKPESYLGVDIGAGGIKLVELKKSKDRPQLWTYGILEEPLDIHSTEPERVERYAELLKHLLKNAKTTTKKTTASLPVSYVFQAVVNLPKMEDKEIEHIVMAEVKKMLPRPIEEMQVIFQKIPELGQGGDKNKFLRILVTAAPKELVAFYTAIFQRAGLELNELETGAFALERSLVGKDNAIAMIVDMGAQRTDLFIIEQGLPVTQRSITVGGETFDRIIQSALGCEKSELAQIKKDLARSSAPLPKELFQPILDPIIKEIDYSFDLFLHQTGNADKRPEKIIFTGGSSVFPFIAEEVKKNFPMKVFVGDPWARVIYQDSLKPVLDGIGPRMGVAIGLAMRNFK